MLWVACGYRECISLMIFGAIHSNIEFYSTMCGILYILYGGVYIIMIHFSNQILCHFKAL